MSSLTKPEIAVLIAAKIAAEDDPTRQAEFESLRKSIGLIPRSVGCNNHLPESTIRRIRQLIGEGRGVRYISRDLGIALNTAMRYCHMVRDVDPIRSSRSKEIMRQLIERATQAF